MGSGSSNLVLDGNPKAPMCHGNHLNSILGDSGTFGAWLQSGLSRASTASECGYSRNSRGRVTIMETHIRGE